MGSLFGSLSSAYSWLQNKVNSSFGSTPAANMSLNSNNNSFGSPVKIDFSDSAPMQVYNPFVNRVSDAITGGVSLNKDDLTSPKATPPSGGHSAQEYYSAPVQELDYLNAEIAKHYGMSKETAYQEALSNTAYQRSIKDMQAAGLNPAVIYGAGKGSPADGVYHVSSAGSAGSGGSGFAGSTRRYGGSSKNNDKLFTPGEFYGLSAAAGLFTAVVTKNPANYWLGQTVTQGFMTAADSLFRK